MYRKWDLQVLLAFLSKEEYNTVIRLMDKGREGTITQEEADIVDRLIEKNNSHIESPSDEELERMLKEEEEK